MRVRHRGTFNFGILRCVFFGRLDLLAIESRIKDDITCIQVSISLSFFFSVVVVVVSLRFWHAHSVNLSFLASLFLLLVPCRHQYSAAAFVNFSFHVDLSFFSPSLSSSPIAGFSFYDVCTYVCMSEQVDEYEGTIWAIMKSFKPSPFVRSFFSLASTKYNTLMCDEGDREKEKNTNYNPITVSHASCCCSSMSNDDRTSKASRLDVLIIMFDSIIGAFLFLFSF